LRRDHLLLIPLLLAAGSFGLGFVWSADLWWYLATGREILAAGGIPARDVFVYSLDPPAPWLTHSWLWTVALAAVERACGLAALPMLATALVAALLVILHRCARVDRYGVVNTLLVFGVLMAGCYRFSLRAELPGWLFFLVFLVRLERRPRRPAELALLFGLEVLWANLHASFALGILLAACCAVGSAIQGWLAGRRGDERTPGPSPWLVPLLACAPLATPGLGADRLADTLGVLRALVSDPSVPAPGALDIIEWASPWSLRFSAQPPALHAAFTLVGLASFAVARRPRDPSRALVFATMALIGALALRFLTGFAIAAAFVALRNLAGTPVRVRAPQIAQAACAGALGVGLAAVAAGTWLSRADYEVGQSGGGFTTLNPRNLAPGAAAFILRHELEGPLFNEIQLGGYLAWRLYPEHRVFVDGRILDARLWHEHRDILLGRGFPRALREHGFNLVVLSNLAQRHLPLRRLLRSDPDWRLVYLDPQAVVFARSPFGLPEPEIHVSSIAGGAGAPFVGDPAAPTWRRIAARPLLDGSSLALLDTYLEALVELGMPAQAAELAGDALARGVDTAVLHGRRGRALLQLGRPAEAVADLRIAAEAEPASAAALYEYARALAGAGDTGAAIEALDRALARDPAHLPAARLRRRLAQRDAARRRRRSASEPVPAITSSGSRSGSAPPGSAGICAPRTACAIRQSRRGNASPLVASTTLTEDTESASAISSIVASG
jgi:tetratricopeptide (TPR) repeat protein